MGDQSQELRAQGRDENPLVLRLAAHDRGVRDVEHNDVGVHPGRIHSQLRRQPPRPYVVVGQA